MRRIGSARFPTGYLSASAVEAISLGCVSTWTRGRQRAHGDATTVSDGAARQTRYRISTTAPNSNTIPAKLATVTVSRNVVLVFAPSA
jgi:hypothetical protein